MFIYKIVEVKFCMLPKYHNVTLAANNSAAYTPCLPPYKKLFLTDIPLKVSQINLKIMCIQKIKKGKF